MITFDDIKQCPYAKIEGTSVEYRTPKKEERLNMSYRDLCICNAIEALKFREFEGALKNANGWLNRGDDGKLRELYL